MNRTARKVAMSAAAGAVALALTSPAAVADDGDGYEGERDGYSEEYDEYQSDDSDDGDEDDSDEDYESDDDSEDESDDDESGDDSDDDHEDGDEHDEYDEYDDDSAGREYDAYRERHHEDHAEEPHSHSAYRGHGDGDSRHEDRHEKWGDQATGNTEDADERASQTESFIEQQTAILTHLSRADAFLADLSERISAADLDPGLKNALLSLIDERRNHLAGLVAQVRTATSWEDLKSLRDDAYGEMTEPTT